MCAAAAAAILCAMAAGAQGSVYTLSHTSGTYNTTQFVQVSCESGASVYYTTDGSTPTESSEKYKTVPIIVTENTVIKTAAYSDGELMQSDTVKINIATVSPTASKDSGEYSKGFKVKLTCTDDTAVIYYTTDGTAPTKSSSKYSGAITISETTTLRFAAYGDNLSRSNVITRKYVISEDTYSDPYRQALLEAVNEVRAEYGLSPLKTMTALDEIAQQRAEECSVYFSHYRPNGTKWDSLLSAAGLKRNERAENIAYYHTTAKAALQSWMNDYSHRKNILNPELTYIGIGYYNNGYCSYWTQVFIGDD